MTRGFPACRDLAFLKFRFEKLSLNLPAATRHGRTRPAVLAGGRWNDRQVVSKAWIGDSTTPRTEATSNYSYGYLWWLGRSPFNGREVHWAGALGRGGQSIRIVPELDLVVAVTAGYYQDYSPRAFQVQSGVFKDILRAISPSG